MASAVDSLIDKASDEDVEELVLSGHGISEIPKTLWELEHLTTLDLSGNKLTHLPSQIGNLINLTSLNISNNSLLHLPREIERLKSLTTFVVSGNKFGIDVEKVAKAFVSRAQILDISDCDLKHLCPEISILQATLKELVLDGNHLTCLPAELPEMSQLERLSIRDNQLEALEHDICNIVSLTELDVSGNKISRISPEITRLSKLISLNLAANNLTSIPNPVLQLYRLRSLNVSGNRISSLSPLICNLSKLRELDLSNNELTELPRGLFHLNRLQQLILADNQLTEIPFFIHELHNLQDLDLDGNKITYVYNDLGSLAELRRLKLRRNNLIEVSATLGLLPKLERLLLQNNPSLRSPPESVVKEGNSAVIEHLRKSAKKRFTRDLTMRIITLGDAGVGKTSLLYYLKREDEESIDISGGKFGLTIKNWKVHAMDGEADWWIRFKTWDFSLPQYADEILRLYFSGRALFIVVVKLNHPEANHWIRLIKSRVRNPKIFLVVTHCDHKDDERELKKIKDRYASEVTYIIGVSSKKGTNIHKLRGLLTRETIMNPYWKNVTIPIKYDVLVRTLSDVTEPIITRDEFAEVAAKANITKPAQLLRAIRYLREHGHVVVGTGALGPGALIVTKPIWLFEQLMKIYSRAEESLSRTSLTEMFGENRKRLMKVLIDFKLAVLRADGLWFPSIAFTENAALAAAHDEKKVEELITEWIPNAVLHMVYQFNVNIARKFFVELTIEVSHRGRVDTFESDAIVLIASSEFIEGTSVLIVRSQPTVIEFFFKVKGMNPNSAIAPDSGLRQLAQKLNEAVMLVAYNWNNIPISVVTDELPLACYLPSECNQFTTALTPPIASHPRWSRKISHDPESSNTFLTQSGELIQGTAGIFVSEELIANERLRGLHYHYCRLAGQYFLINTSVEFPSFKASDLLGAKLDEDFEHVTRGTWQKRQVAVVKLEEGRLKQSLGKPNYGLVSISHKNVLPILAADVSQNSILLADTLSYSLWELLNENPDELSKPNYLKIAIDIGEGLAHLHTAIPPIYAQNVNSKNILVRKINNTYRAAVSLFGPYSSRSHKIQHDQREDNVFAFGHILAQMICKQAQAESAPGLAQKLKLPTGCPQAISTLIEKCCADDPAERPQMDDVLKELYKLATTTSAQLRIAVQNELEFASTSFLIKRMGIAPLTRFLQDRVLRDQFYEYLVKEYSSENLVFHEAVEAYKSARTKKRIAIAKQIASEILPKINVPEHILEPIKSKIAKDLFPPNLFDNAQREVLTLLENDSYKRFLATQKRITQSPTMK